MRPTQKGEESGGGECAWNGAGGRGVALVAVPALVAPLEALALAVGAEGICEVIDAQVRKAAR